MTIDKTLVGRILVLVASVVALLGGTFTPEHQTLVSNAFYIIIGVATSMKITKRIGEKKIDKEVEK